MLHLKLNKILLSLIIFSFFLPLGSILPKVIHSATLDSISLSVTDNRVSAANNDTIQYLINVKNNGITDIQGISAINSLPEFVSFLNSDIPGFQISGNLISFTIDEIPSGQQRQYKINGRLVLPDGVTGGQLLNAIEIQSGVETLVADDTTQITTGISELQPNFSVFVNCITVNPLNTITVYFGYINKLGNIQNLDSSILTPIQSNNPPNSLQPGRYDKVFSSTISADSNLTWSASAGSISSSITATANSTRCKLQAPNIGINAISSTQLNINWNLISDATYYEVYRDGSLIGSTSSNNYTDINLNPLTTYTYNVRANGVNINSDLSASASETTLDPSISPPIYIPDFSIFVNCVESNNDNTYTAYFGYQNKLFFTQILEESTFSSSFPIQPPQALLSGRFDKAFSLKINLGTSVVWRAKVGSSIRNATVSSNFTKCSSSNQSSGTKVIVNEMPKDIENVDFNENNIKIISDCSTKRISVEGSVKSTLSFSAIEYSLDGGSKWLSINNASGLATSSVDYSITTRSLKDKLYGVKIRAFTSSNTISESKTISYLHDCLGLGNILGSYYQNGFGQGILSNDGDLVYNSSLPLKLFVESIGNISNLKIRISSDKTFSSPEEISAVFDFGSDTWSSELPKEFLNRKINYIELEAISRDKKITKEISRIINTEFINPVEKDMESINYTYELFFYDGSTWQPIDYNRELNPVIQPESYMQFNLYQGSYYFIVNYPSGIKFYSKKFNINEPSVVRVNTDPVSNVWIFKLFSSLIRELDVDIYSRSSINIPSEESESSFDTYLEAYKDKIDSTDADSQSIFVYWNKWNPFLQEQLVSIQKLQNLMKERGSQNRFIYLVTDDNNIEALERELKINNLDLKYIKVESSKFMNEEIKYQIDFSVVDFNSKKVNHIRSNLNYVELLKELVRVGYIE